MMEPRRRYKRTKENPVHAWWFGHDVLGYGDRRSVEVGAHHTVNGAIELCYNGLHACRRAWDAAAQSPWSASAYVVALWGDIVEQRLGMSPKLAATDREYLVRIPPDEWSPLDREAYQKVVRSEYRRYILFATAYAPRWPSGQYSPALQKIGLEFERGMVGLAKKHLGLGSAC